MFERSGRVGEASVRNFGLLTSLYDDGEVWGNRAYRSRQLYQQWHAAGGCPLSTPGSLQLAQTPLQLALLRAFAAQASTLRYPVALLDPQQALALQPALSQQPGAILGALHFPKDALLEPRLMFHATAGVPGALARQGVRFHWSTPIASLRPSSSSSVALETPSGEVFHAGRVVLASGSDVHTLAPGAFQLEAPRLQLCKLQMMRLRLPRAAGTGSSNPTITSGLSLRRYPALAAVCPAEHAAMMAGEGGAGHPAMQAAEALGIHVIARPAAALPSTAFGAVDSSQQPLAVQPPLSSDEWVVGDSHEYWPLPQPGQPSAATADEACSEGVSNAILAVAGGMLQGVPELLQWRQGGGGGGEGGAAARAPSAAVLQQWSGTYLTHSAGYFSAAFVPSERPGQQPLSMLTGKEAAACAGGTVHIATGIGGKGMTMGPALGEEFVQQHFA